MQVGDDNWEQDDECEPFGISTTVVPSRIPEEMSESSSLAEVFGDYGQSEFSTMALVRKVSCLQLCDRPAAISKIDLVTCRNH